jgi:hypothetical protein
MVTSAVLGAAAGTGFALLIAMTITVCRYYALRRRTKELSELERNAASSLLADERWALGKSRPHQPVYTIIQKVSTSFIHSVSFHLLWRERYAWSDVCLCAPLDGLGTQALFILPNGKCKHTNVNIALKNTNTIQQYTKPKTIDKNQDYNTSGIYKLTCNTCKMSYKTN